MVKDIKLYDSVICKKYGVVLDTGAKSDSDATSLDTSSIIKDGDIYKMWYGGSDGNKWRIHYATSIDGIIWDKHGLVLDVGYTGCTDSYDVSTPCVIRDGTIYKMWYTGYDGNNYRIHYATSTDGISWTKHGVVIPLGDDGESEDIHTYYPSVIYDGTLYKMWYSGNDGNNTRIFYNTSTDGINWDKGGIAVDFGTTYMSGDNHLYAPSVIYDGTIYEMCYSSYDYVKHRIFYATSTDGITWDKNGEVKLLLDNSDDAYIDTPCIIKDGDIKKIWYSCYNGSRKSIQYAEL